MNRRAFFASVFGVGVGVIAVKPQLSAQVAAYEKAIRSGMLSPNEARTGLKQWSLRMLPPNNYAGGGWPFCDSLSEDV